MQAHCYPSTSEQRLLGPFHQRAMHSETFFTQVRPSVAARMRSIELLKADVCDELPGPVFVSEDS